ncbi:7666_t:CDS:10, partial [Funneliformis caledonium]
QMYCYNRNDSDTREQKITPWEVEGAVINGQVQAIDYNKLIEKFGTQLIDNALLQRFQKLTGKEPHTLLRRGIFFSHREFSRILDRYEQGKPFFIYTGRGPSSSSMHLGHMVPFVFCKWLQEAFNVPIVIQLTDDEKFIFKPELKFEDARQFARENAKDIIACGFDLDKTFIFSNTDYVGGPFYHNIVKIAKCITYNQSKATFGFNDSDCIGKNHFVAIQSAPSFSNSFPQIFGTRHDIPCVIPCAIDQDPYFRLTRDVAHKLKYPKPSLLHAKFFPSLQGSQTKMSASVDNSAIFMSDTPNQIKKKACGGVTAELHRENGGNPDVDVPYQYLSVFLDDDEELASIYEKYKSGEMLTGEIKARCIDVLQKFVGDFQKPNPQLVSLLQGKLGQLIGKSSGYIENLPEDVKARINSLKYYQAEHAKLEAKFQEEILALEKKYLELYRPLYETRSKIVRGEREPTVEEVQAGVKLDEEEQTKEEENVVNEENKVQEIIEGPVKGIPEFWLTSMKNLITIEEIITERDEDALKHLIDIRMSYLEKPGFRLDFEFEENPYFTNTLLTKTYYYQEEPGYGGDFVYDHAEGTPINWKEGKDLTVTVETKRQKRKGTKETRVVKTTVPAESFFQFFNPPTELEEDNDDLDDNIDERLEMDYQIGEDIKEKLIPRAIDWYTGKALKYEEIEENPFFTGGKNGKTNANNNKIKGVLNRY